MNMIFFQKEVKIQKSFDTDMEILFIIVEYFNKNFTVL